MFSRVALRAVVAPRAVVLPRAQAARTFLTSLPRYSDVEPTVLGMSGPNSRRGPNLTRLYLHPPGPGGKTGEVPTDIEQATGLERFELLHKLKGEEAFSLEPLQMDRLGTLADPIRVFSLVSRPSLSHLSFSSSGPRGYAIRMGCETIKRQRGNEAIWQKESRVWRVVRYLSPRQGRFGNSHLNVLCAKRRNTSRVEEGRKSTSRS